MTKHTTLGEALAAAQGDLKDPAKTKENPHYKSRYAGMDDILEVVRPVLSKHGIAFTQLLDLLEDGKQVLITRLWVGDGEGANQLVSRYLVPSHSDPQKLRSAVTYARRTSLEAIVGVAGADDDDAESFVRGPSGGQRQTSTTTKRRSTPSRSASTPSRRADADTDAATTKSWEDAPHHPSWEAHRPTFCAQLNVHGTDYDTVKAATLRLWGQKPSQWSLKKRQGLLDAFKKGTAWETLGLERPEPEEPTYDADALAGAFTGEQPEA